MWVYKSLLSPRFGEQNNLTNRQLEDMETRGESLRYSLKG